MAKVEQSIGVSTTADEAFRRRASFAVPSCRSPRAGGGDGVLYLSLRRPDPAGGGPWAVDRRGLGSSSGTPVRRTDAVAALKLTVGDVAARRRHERGLRHAAGLGAGARRFIGKNAGQLDHRPAVRAADDRRRPGAGAALRPVSSPIGIDVAYSRAGILLALMFETLPFVVRSVQPVLLRARPRHGGGGRFAGRGAASRSFAASSSPTCCRRCCPAAGWPSPRRSASSARSPSSQATSRSRPRWPRC